MAGLWKKIGKKHTKSIEGCSMAADVLAFIVWLRTNEPLFFKTYKRFDLLSEFLKCYLTSSKIVLGMLKNLTNGDLQ